MFGSFDLHLGTAESAAVNPTVILLKAVGGFVQMCLFGNEAAPLPVLSHRWDGPGGSWQNPQATATA